MVIPIFYQMPTWVLGLLFVVILLGALEAGYRIGLWRGRKTGESSKKEEGDFALTAMYALLGLVMAFTYAFTVSRADLRKMAVVDEANAIGTAFLRAGIAPEPTRTELRQLLLDYAKTRVIPVETSLSKDRIREVLTRTLQAQSKIWPATERMVRDNPAGPVAILIVPSINQVIDMHTKRFAVSFDRLPGIVLLMLLFIAGASVTMSGFNAGLSGGMNRWRLTTLAIILAAVLLVITDFDRPLRGFVRVSQQSLENVIRDMEAILSK
jgi:hypothetical protein